MGRSAVLIRAAPLRLRSDCEVCISTAITQPGPIHFGGYAVNTSKWIRIDL